MQLELLATALMRINIYYLSKKVVSMEVSVSHRFPTSSPHLRTSTTSYPPKFLKLSSVVNVQFLPSKIRIFTARPFGSNPMNPHGQSTIASAFDNGSPVTSSHLGRVGEVKRETNETNFFVKINLDGTGVAENSTGVPFLDHMLDQLASHGLLDVQVKAKRDYHIDDHHTNEDVALSIGTDLLQELGDRKGINRFGDFSASLDEALVHVSLDLSSRPRLSYDLHIPTERAGTCETQLVDNFF